MWNRRLGRTADHRVALLKNQATDLILKGKIETTEMKAMELRSVVDHLITIAKKNDLAARRQAAAYLRNVTTKDGKTAVQVLFEEVAPKYKDRNGGYTRVNKTGIRRGDAAKMATIELV
ncbi:MAG: 50S ribosomal protein L17 [Erysipelotrichaceae bacterium]|nr:50S ribosomal protein L17 [Erysipelotrichaceae bacterium]MBQ6217531.1 50S ribosomal protein L17 [Erysipelotrichaceae bacterium]MBR6725205.1 50S ribosomal protein L17 [Erysipelotrichaceae bacterium]